MLKPDTILKKRYRIQSIIASGGMAVVYRGYDNYLHRSVAIKILRPEVTKNIKNLVKFDREVEATTRIKHPNVVTVYDVFVEKNYWCLILELIEGYTLKSLISKAAPLENGEAINIMLHILDGIEAAHKIGIIHRDLKPANVLIAYDGQVRVSDFGIAMIDQESGKATKENKIVGTMKYIAPEIVQGHQGDARSDIYSLGIILYEMLVGTVPFRGFSPMALAVKHIREPFPYPTRYNKTIVQPLENAILKATAKDPNERYQTSTEFIHDLKTVLSTERATEKRVVLTNKVQVTKRNRVKKTIKLRLLRQAMPFYLRWPFIIGAWAIIIIVIVVVIISIWVVGD